MEQILKRVAAEFEPIMDQPAPEVWLTRFTHSAIELALLVYFDFRVITKERLLGEINFHIWDGGCVSTKGETILRQPEPQQWQEAQTSSAILASRQGDQNLNAIEHYQGDLPQQN